jgi:uncharacterized repeat protein (TIGR01451 family)
MRVIRKIFFIALITINFCLFAQPLWAAVRCEPQYGGGEICVRLGALQINKLVWDPESHAFVDNLSAARHRFLPGEEVIFRIRVKNTGDATFGQVNVDDTMPSFLRRIGGENLNFHLADLRPGEEREVEIKAEVTHEVSVDQCDVNMVVARADDQEAKDAAQICVTKKVAEVKVLPKTGFSSAMILPAVFLFGLLGIALLLT